MSHEGGSIQGHMKSDFKAVMTAFATQRDSVGRSFTEIGRQMQAINDALAKQEDALSTYVERTDAHFAQMLGVDDSLEQRLTSVEARLDAIERKQAG